MIKLFRKVTTPTTIAAYLLTSLFGGVPFALAALGDETTYYLLTDHLGSVDVVLDDTGNVVERRDFLPYGSERLTDSTGTVTKTDHKFTGKELDDETGLYYYGARYYDAEIGRFMSIDPLVLDEAKMTDENLISILNNPQKLNSYGYALNNPIFYTDLYGESPYTDKWRGAGNIIDGAVHYTLGTGIILGSAQTMHLVGGIVVQQEGIFEAAWGTAQVASDDALRIEETDHWAVKGAKKVLGYTVKGAGTVGRVAEAANSIGYSDGLEAVGEMIENDVSFDEFVQSIPDAAAYEFDNAINKINDYTDAVSEIFTNDSVENNKEHEDAE